MHCVRILAFQLIIVWEQPCAEIYFRSVKLCSLAFFAHLNEEMRIHDVVYDKLLIIKCNKENWSCSEQLLSLMINLVVGFCFSQQIQMKNDFLKTTILSCWTKYENKISKDSDSGIHLMRQLSNALDHSTDRTPLWFQPSPGSHVDRRKKTHGAGRSLVFRAWVSWPGVSQWEVDGCCK